MLNTNLKPIFALTLLPLLILSCGKGSDKIRKANIIATIAPTAKPEPAKAHELDGLTGAEFLKAKYDAFTLSCDLYLQNGLTLDMLQPSAANFSADLLKDYDKLKEFSLIGELDGLTTEFRFQNEKFEVKHYKFKDENNLTVDAKYSPRFQLAYMMRNYKNEEERKEKFGNEKFSPNNAVDVRETLLNTSGMVSLKADKLSQVTSGDSSTVIKRFEIVNCGVTTKIKSEYLDQYSVDTE